MAVPQATVEAGKLCHLFSEAVRTGDIAEAQKHAAELARLRCPLNITPAEKDILVVVQIFQGGKDTNKRVVIMLTPQTTFKELKFKFSAKCNVTIDRQRWIVNNEISPDDGDTLAKYGIDRDDAVLILYLLKEVNTPKEHHAEWSEAGRVTPNSPPDTPYEEVVHVRREQVQPPALAPVVLQAPKAPPPLPIPRPAAAVPRPPPRWDCPACTLANLPYRPSCEMCSTDRPETYKIPADYRATPEETKFMDDQAKSDAALREMQEKEKMQREAERKQHFEELVSADDADIVLNPDEFDCPICYTTVEPGEGIILRECLHNFCRECVASHISEAAGPQVFCPYADNDYACDKEITQREMLHLVPANVFERFQQASLNIAALQSKDTARCRTVNCPGMLVLDPGITQFLCQICNHLNCLNCQALHTGQTCEQYQEELKLKVKNKDDEMKNDQAIQEMIKAGLGMECPNCKIIVMKDVGCDWIRCAICKCEICWATKGPRWGPKGNGDTTGGCRCNINGLCTPTCQNCH